MGQEGEERGEVEGDGTAENPGDEIRACLQRIRRFELMSQVIQEGGIGNKLREETRRILCSSSTTSSAAEEQKSRTVVVVRVR